MTRRERLTDLGFRVLYLLHRSVLFVSAGRVGARAFGMEVVELATIGRRSGLRRHVLLTVPVIGGDALVLVASKGGDDRDPDWLRNLLINPDVEVTSRGVQTKLRARVASNEESAALWPQIVKVYGPYEHYRKRAHRVIPLVICEPYPRA